jgi:hypothetical protein
LFVIPRLPARNDKGFHTILTAFGCAGLCNRD